MEKMVAKVAEMDLLLNQLLAQAVGKAPLPSLLHRGQSRCLIRMVNGFRPSCGCPLCLAHFLQGHRRHQLHC